MTVVDRLLKKSTDGLFQHPSKTRIGAVALVALFLFAGGCTVDPYSMVEGDAVKIHWTVPPFTWVATVSNFSGGLSAQPGEAWSFDYDVEVDLGLYRPKYGEFTQVVLAVQGDWRHDEDGYYRSGSSTFALSSNFTTTGVPIEHFDSWPSFRLLQGKNGSPFEGVAQFNLSPGKKIAGKHRFSGRMTVNLPEDTPVGYYEPRFYVLIRVRDVPDPVHLGLFGYEWNDWWPPSMPLVKVGDPATPKLPWTILSQAKTMGRSGVLPEQLKGRVELCNRSGFPSSLILPPGRYDISPEFPFVYPRRSISPIDGGVEVVPGRHDHFLLFNRGQVSCSIDGPTGAADLGSKIFVGEGDGGPMLQNGPFPVDMTRTGHYTITMKGAIEDAYGRRFEGGGTYKVIIANPLTFSTSCKPGTSFLVGGGYPAKVNVNPPFPALVEVRVEYYPDSDPERKRTWVAKGRANRFGHFVPYGKPPIIFDEPGEYFSRVSAAYVDSAGVLWMGEQTSVGVVAPHQRVLKLHGTRNFPFNNKLDRPYYGAVKRYADRANILTSFMPETPYMLMDPFFPYDSRDTLFLPASVSEENIVEPHLSMEIVDPALRDELLEHYTRRSMMVPEFYQPWYGPWNYLHNVVQLSIDSFGLFSVEEDDFDELPVQAIGADGWHPVGFPQKKRFEAYTTMGVVRPGFPVMTSVFQVEALGLYWVASPNRHGYHVNAGFNGDLPGDLYRIQAGAVLLDLETGTNLYDAYASAITVTKSDGKHNAVSVLEPGRRPLLTTNGREHWVFLATDAYDALEIGETLGFGGMVFPAVEADVNWVVTKPSGEKIFISGKSNRLGLVRGRPSVPADELGIYKVEVSVRYEELEGDVVGTKDGTFWHCVVPQEDPNLLEVELAAVVPVDPVRGIRIPLSWPEELRDVKLYFGVIMPGQVLDQGVVEPLENAWEYPFDPIQMAAQFPNFDARDFGTGRWGTVDTVVFQFFLEGQDEHGRVFDSARLVLRRGRLYNYEVLLAGDS